MQWWTVLRFPPEATRSTTARFQDEDGLAAQECRAAGEWLSAVLGRLPAPHEEAVARLTLALAHQAGEVGDEAAVRRAVWAGTLHDIGKSVVDPRILDKPAPLSPAERAVMQRHPSVGHRLASTAPQMDAAGLAAILYHHERWDGEGYPVGLIGESIPVLARILTIADVYDALCRERPYRPAWTPGEAGQYLRAHAGLIFDPRLVGIFMERVLPELGSGD
ncbi:HD-GYP domain-containing protein [uncultured Deinococcus sp.]|uniref:HD-GYP domain-containing protein n=1 Tax=uncultured Deinococcus sp. TaxID=158789 RepID=UPI0025898D7F|nr:HD-GYP domain-containing protein [uncultured Deinococcus sp.]